MKKTIVLFFTLMVLTIFCGCVENRVESKENDVIDTVTVLEYTDELFLQRGYEKKKRSISQRTDNEDIFVVEYWYNVNDTEQHYGYYIEVKDDICSVLAEEKDVNQKYLE